MTRVAAAIALLVVAACARNASFDSAPAGPRSGQTGQPAPAPAPAPTPAADPHLFDRVAVLGASVSAGFAAPRIAAAMHDAMREPRDILDVASVWMFRDVWTDGARQVDAAAAHAPTLTVALDFLFWYAYRSTGPAERAASLERGLAELARLPPGPLALGDLPDMSGASDAILHPDAVPAPDELARMNTRVHAWAAARPRTVVLPLGAWSARLAAGERVEVAPGETVDATSLLFVDGLHVNALGLWWLLSQIDATLEQELHAAPDGLRFIR